MTDVVKIFSNLAVGLIDLTKHYLMHKCQCFDSNTVHWFFRFNNANVSNVRFSW